LKDWHFIVQARGKRNDPLPFPLVRIIHISDQDAKDDFHVDPTITNAITLFNQPSNFNPATGAWTDRQASETFVLDNTFDMRNSITSTIAHEMAHYIGLDGPGIAQVGKGTWVDDYTAWNGAGSYAYQAGSECSGQ
jgi:hypothetical protein